MAVFTPPSNLVQPPTTAAGTVQLHPPRHLGWSRSVLAASGLVASLMLAGCDLAALINDQMSVADAKATGGACRHAMRGIEDCYKLNPRAPRAAVYEGWRDMDAYMRENKLEGMAPANLKPASAKGEEVVEDEEPPRKPRSKAAS